MRMVASVAEISMLVCDACQKQKDERVEATQTLRLMIDGQPLRIDACSNHADQFSGWLSIMKDVGWQDQQMQLAAVSHLPGQGRRRGADLLSSPGATGCPACFKLMATPGTVNQHLRKKHLRKPEEWTPEQRAEATQEARRRLAAGEEVRLEQ